MFLHAPRGYWRTRCAVGPELSSSVTLWIERWNASSILQRRHLMCCKHSTGLIMPSCLSYAIPPKCTLTRPALAVFLVNMLGPCLLGRHVSQAHVTLRCLRSTVCEHPLLLRTTQSTPPPRVACWENQERKCSQKQVNNATDSDATLWVGFLAPRSFD